MVIRIVTIYEVPDMIYVDLSQWYNKKKIFNNYTFTSFFYSQFYHHPKRKI